MSATKPVALHAIRARLTDQFPQLAYVGKGAIVSLELSKCYGESNDYERGFAACAECGMSCEPGEYHPFLACLEFKACRDSKVVRANLREVRTSIAGSVPEPYTVEHIDDEGDGYYARLRNIKTGEAKEGTGHTIEEAVAQAVRGIGT